MIISASRRTDIPALYADWFLNRLKAGYVLIPHPCNAERISRVTLLPEQVDCIVFWTKNAAPALDMLPLVEKMGYRFYFQVTLTPYGPTLEQNLPTVSERIKTFQTLSRLIGAHRVVWRYDPVTIDQLRTVSWHLQQFETLCHALSGYITRCIFSFIFPYRHLKNRFAAVQQHDIHQIAAGFSSIAQQYDITLFSCAEKTDLQPYQISHAACIDKALVEQMVGCGINSKKDMRQRDGCQCIKSVDIGVYDTCINGCIYCYACSDNRIALQQFKHHHPEAPMLSGYPTGHEIITDRTFASQKMTQLSLF